MENSILQNTACQLVQCDRLTLFLMDPAHGDLYTTIFNESCGEQQEKNDKKRGNNQLETMLLS